MEQNEPYEKFFIPAGPRRMPETLIAYARPLIDRLPADYTLEELRATLYFAVTVWNSLVLRDLRGVLDHLDTKMPPRLRVRPSRQLATVRRMVDRWHRHFHSDDHFIAAMGVSGDVDGVMRVTAFGVCPDPRCCGPQAKA